MRTIEELGQAEQYEGTEVMDAVVGRTEYDAFTHLNLHQRMMVRKAVANKFLKVVKGVYAHTAAYKKHISPPKPRTEKQMKVARSIMTLRDK